MGNHSFKQPSCSDSPLLPSQGKKHAFAIAAGQFIPFYLGKEKNVRSRLEGHLNAAQASSTYSLKLLERAHLLTGIQFKVSALALSVDDEAYFCVSLFEAALRKLLHPIIGRQ